MKKNCFLLTAVFIILFSQLNSAYAIDTGSLTNFNATKAMVPATFSDVKNEEWYYMGIKTAYDYAIMDGVGGGRFSPLSNLTQAQAITIAARVHAIYSNKTIAETGSTEWYQKYYTYAEENDLLPPAISGMTGIDSKNTTRSEIAFMFSQILSAEDSALINDLEIPDIDLIETDYADPVKKMYAAGIIGGKNGGIFNGSGLATRAEIATIIGRIIDPLNRLPNDSRYNTQIIGQEGNIQDYQKVFQDGDTIYFVCWDEENDRYNIVRHDIATKKNEVIYHSKTEIYKSSYPQVGQMILYNRDIYFVEKEYNADILKRESTLKKVNLDTMTVSDLYNGETINGYTIYGGEIYVLNLRDNPNWYYRTSGEDVPSYYYDIIKLNGRKTEKLASGEDFAYNLSAINNRLYYYNNSQIIELQIATKKTTPVLEAISSAVIYGNVTYYSDQSGSIYKAMLSNTSSKKLLYSGDTKKTGYTTSINYYDGSVYFNYNWLSRIDVVNTAGQWSSTPTKTNDIRFGIFNGNYIYTDCDGNDCVAPIGSDPSQHILLTKWLATGGAGFPSVTLPVKNKDMTEKLTAEQIYAQCAPAIFRIEIYDSNSQFLGSASGFMISSDGIAVTNYHVLMLADKFKVILPDGREFWPETILGESLNKEISIFKIDGSGFDYLKIGDSETLAGGQNIFTIGSPYGLESTISSGLISNPSRDFGDGYKWIQISAPISPGSSGGALIDEYGRVVGITTMSLVLENAQNVNIAVPIDWIYTIFLE